MHTHLPSLHTLYWFGGSNPTGRLHVILVNSMLESVHRSARTVPTPLKSLSALQHYPLRLGFIKEGEFIRQVPHWSTKRDILCEGDLGPSLCFSSISFNFSSFHSSSSGKPKRDKTDSWVSIHSKVLWVGFQWFGEPKGWETGKGCPPWK